MSVLDKLDGPKSKQGLPSTEALIERVKEQLEEDWVGCFRACVRRPDTYKQKISAILCVRKATGADLISAKRWVEKHITLPMPFNL